MATITIDPISGNTSSNAGADQVPVDMNNGVITPAGSSSIGSLAPKAGLDPYTIFTNNIAGMLKQAQQQNATNQNTLGGAKDALTSLSVAPNGPTPFDPTINSNEQVAGQQNLQKSFDPAITAIATQQQNQNANLQNINQIANTELNAYKPVAVNPGQTLSTPGGQALLRTPNYQSPTIRPDTGNLDSFDSANGVWKSDEGAQSTSGGSTPSAKPTSQIDAIFGASNPIGAYATDPNYVQEISGLYNTVKGLGVANSPDTLQQYINNNAKGAPVTGQMIINAAQTYGIDPALLTTTLLHESDFGTAGPAVNTMNPGNQGNTGTSTQTYGSWQQGVLATAKNIAHRISAASTAGSQTASPAPTEDPKGNTFSTQSQSRIAQLPQSVQKYVLAGPGGVAYIDGDAATTAGVGQVANSFGAKSGVPVFYGDDISRMKNINDLTQQMQYMSALVDKNLKNKVTNSSTLSHGLNFLSSFGNLILQNKPDLTNFNSYVGGVTTAANNLKTLAGGSNSGLRITGVELAGVADSLPNSMDSWANARAKIDAINTKIAQSMHTVFPDVDPNSVVAPQKSSGGPAAATPTSTGSSGLSATVGGQTWSFSSQAALDAFKREAGIQ